MNNDIIDLSPPVSELELVFAGCVRRFPGVEYSTPEGKAVGIELADWIEGKAAAL